jgi:hypothetical protein
MKCTRCDDTGWVCEIHIMKPWEGPEACACGAAGVPCGRCNDPPEGQAPRLPERFKTEFDEDGWRP